MAGDVNVFFSDDSGGVDGTTAEIEIMIAGISVCVCVGVCVGVCVWV